MQILPLIYKQFYSVPKPAVTAQSNDSALNTAIYAFVESSKLPDEKINYFTFDENLVSKIVSKKEKSIAPVLTLLQNNDDEKSVTAGLYLLNRLFDAGTTGLESTYPVISKFNYHKSPNVQVMLSGVYRKTQVPDAFGPLMNMYMQDCKNHNPNSDHKSNSISFDPKEEVGGAILSYLENPLLAQALIEYLRNQASVNNYSNNLENQQNNFCLNFKAFD